VTELLPAEIDASLALNLSEVVEKRAIVDPHSSRLESVVDIGQDVTVSIKKQVATQSQAPGCSLYTSMNP
jgi:predicted RNA binding protein with dsRBD fold (UPF0201 family)